MKIQNITKKWNMIKKIIPLLAVLLGSVGCSSPNREQVSAQTFHYLDSLRNVHQYFTFRDSFQNKRALLADKEEMILEAQLHSIFNRRETSNEIIGQLFQEHESSLTESDSMTLLETKISNSLFLYDYRTAIITTESLLSSSSINDEKRKEHENNLIIYRALENTPAQTIHLSHSEQPLTKDVAGLFRIPVSLNGTEQKVVFDTGANFSVITDSLALKAGLTIKESTFKVTSITGAEINSRIGIADSLHIGNSLLKNSIFLVFPEKSLSFPQANYTIDAILGFPVINALKEIQLVNGRKFIISGSTSTTIHENMALDFLTPIVEVVQNGNSLPFTFDTGASTTALYEDYFQLHEAEIRAANIRDTLNVGGAGGVSEVPVYLHPFSGQIGDSHFKLDTTAIYETNLRDQPGIHGNLGQDILSQFDTLLLNFEKMALQLK